MKIRLNKYLATCGIASRRAAEKLIAEGKCTVNGVTVTEMGHMVDPGSDEITVGEKKLTRPKNKIYIMLNKPRGYVTTVKDQFGRPAVMDLIDTDERLYPVGRLDYDTSGLLLLTNDGGLTNKLTHPKYGVKKTYMAKIKGKLPADAINRFESGVMIDGYKTAPAVLKIVKNDDMSATVKIIIKEGKNRQVKKMFEAMGIAVISLKRTGIGNLRLGALKTGECRELTPNEIDSLFGGFIN